MKNKGLLVAAFVVLLIGVIVGIQKRPTRYFVAVNADGFTSVKADLDDPIVKDTYNFVETYSKWLESHPTEVKQDDALEKFVELHNNYAKDCKRDGVKVPQITVKAINNGLLYPEQMAGVRAYLRKHGWASGFIAPTVGATTNGKSRVIGIVYIGKVIARKEVSVKRPLDGKVVHYVQDIAEDLTSPKLANFRMTASSDVGYTVISIKPLVTSALSILETCGKNSNSIDKDSLEFLDYGQWYGSYKSLGKKKCFSLILNDLITATAVHERQHLYDYELLSANSLPMSNDGRQLIKAFLEARALMAGIADTPTPVYGLRHMNEWNSSSVKANKSAVLIAEGFLHGKLTLGENDDISKSLNNYGKLGLLESDRFYKIVLRNLSKPDPVGTALEEYAKLRESKEKVKPAKLKAV